MRALTAFVFAFVSTPSLVVVLITLGSLGLLLAPLNVYSQSTSVTFGKSEWTLRITAQDAALLRALRPNTYIPWCFDFIKGRGMLKQITLSLHWPSEAVPQLALAKKEIQTFKEDKDIISCLNASLKAFPPQHERAEDQLEFTLIRNRR